MQFVHPGFEYPFRAGEPGVMDWKPGKVGHNRKFLLATGSYVDGRTSRDHQSVPLAFWGEWEGPSVRWRIHSSGKPLPRVVHAPFRPIAWPSEIVQNTDPMVFGDAFIYSNCLQPTYPTLCMLSPGSIVLFGRYGCAQGCHSFGLDTCLVVGRVELPRAVGEPWGDDLVVDAVLRPLESEGATYNFTIYSGSTGPAEPFSFFPAHPWADPPPLFSRPELTPTTELKGVMNPKNNQGIKLSSGLSEAERDSVWAEVARQVTDHGCKLGYRADPPPLISEQDALSAAAGPPTSLAR